MYLEMAHICTITFRKQLLEEFDHMRLLGMLMGKAALACRHCAARSERMYAD